MDGTRPLLKLIHRKSCRVRGPRPTSWISSPDSSSNERRRDTWSWSIPSPNLSRGSTICSTTSTASSDCSVSSTSSPVRTPDLLVECSEKPYRRPARRRKPVGPRPPRDSSCVSVRPGLLICTSLPEPEQLQRENPPTTPVHDTAFPRSPHVPPFTVDSPTNYALDWDAIFEILECSEAFPDIPGELIPHWSRT